MIQKNILQEAYDPSGGRGIVGPMGLPSSNNYPPIKNGQNTGFDRNGSPMPVGGSGFQQINPHGPIDMGPTGGFMDGLSPPGGSGFYEANNPPTGGIKPAGTYQPPTPGLSPGNTLTGIQPSEQLNPTGGIKPMPGNTGVMGPPMIPGSTGGVMGPPKTPQITRSGKNTGINGGMQNNSLSGALGAAPSSMGGLSSPKRTMGMPNPRPTRNFGSRLNSNRGTQKVV